ncbi:crotonase/enoyl-CoA hydratase family protein [Roseococcus suduntuyensis]|uniref:Enoyl-CoA hydratase/carnithine racemase n=1 Tax=Roseococcus suduntuyensis TaxID=455361 RepID=A0A840AFE2_9PROT|nr:crotonase/enoyl-CoA hydratase family protein [Roseococcus suduntuyensis]MBB3899777.1 enoyl-CoA hydratase/carnithine racemase [Roseococcus suduntuyensis]
MTQELVSLEMAGSVALLGLNRPAKRNAISDALLEALEVRLVEAQRAARAIILHGHGPCFCAGLDLSEHRARTAEEVFHHSRGWHRVFRALREGPIPAIAAVHGACVGGGLELAAACHIRVADATAVFALPEGTRGIFVGGGATVHVARLIGTARMTDMMLTGRTLDAAAAERAGLVTYLEPAGEALTRACEVAARVAQAAPLTVAGVLHALPRIQDMSESDGLFVESLMAALAQTAPEAERRLAAFLEKRAPKAIQTLPSGD